MKKIITLLILLASFAANVNAASFDGIGAGTAATPYLISSAAQLKELAVLVNAGTVPYANAGIYYKLTADISLSDYQTGVGWVPIGHAGANRFKGNFNGNGKTITGLKINYPSYYSTGLFGSINGGTVQNLCISGANITGYSWTGGVAGWVEGTITNCYVTGAVSGSATSVGGVAGYVSSGTISDCYSTATVSGTSSVGGVAGRIESGEMKNCYATGAVSGTGNSVGGVVGNAGSTASVSNCAALNISVKTTGSSGTVGRVVGSRSGSTPLPLANNVAFNGILNNSNNTTWSGSGADHINGEDISAGAIAADGTIDSRFDSPKWIAVNGKMPILAAFTSGNRTQFRRIWKFRLPPHL
jgi:hypothetical protein